MKFSQKLSLILLLTGLTVLVSLSIAIYIVNYNSTINSQSQYTQAIAHSVASDVDRFLSEKEKINQTLANTSIIKKALHASNLFYKGLEEENRNVKIQQQNIKWKSATDSSDTFVLQYTDNPVAQVLKKQQKSLEGEYGEIFLTNKYGALVASTAKLSTFSHGHKYWWTGAYNNGKGTIFFDDRGYDESVGGYVLGLVVPIKNGTEVIGILKCNLNILGSINELGIGKKDKLLGNFKLIRSGGVIVFEEGFEPLSTQVHESIFQRLKNKNNEAFILDDSGEKYLVGFAEIQLTTGTSGYGFGGSFESIDHKKGNSGESWYILCYRQMSIIQAPLIELINTLFLSGSAIIVLLVLLSYWFGRKISQPLSLLDQATKKLGERDFEYRIDLPQNDEFGNLAVSFNEMAESLHQSTTSISSLRKEVERRTLAERQVSHSYVLLQCIDQLRKQFIQEPDPFLLFPHFLEQILKITDSEFGFVGDVLIDEDGSQYLKLYGLSNLAWNEDTNKLYEEYLERGLEFKKLDNLFGLALTSGTPVFSNDPANDPRGAGFPKGHPAINTFIGIPVYYGERLVGEVGLANRPGGYDQAFVDWVAPIIAALGQIIVERWNDQAREKAQSGLLVSIAKEKEMAKEAKDANRAKSVFLSNMSHELRTPLNAILGYAQLLTEDSQLNGYQHRGIQTIQQSAEHLLILINDILDLATIEAGKMELRPGELRLADFFLSICNIIRVRCKQKGIEFRYETIGLLPVTIQADSLRLRQIILNLLSNAVKFTSNGYCLLKVESHSIEAGKVSLTITVEDSGPGVPVNMQTRIFEPFQQTGERLKYSEGTGLGLSISRQIVQLMNGKLTMVSPVNTQVQPEVGPGCSFILSIDVPSANESVLPPLKEKKVTGYICQGQKTKPKKILIVDDDAGNRSVLRDTLESQNFITEEVSDGSLVLPACEQFAPDVILMDLRMPEVDGFTATRQLKKNEQFVDIPVIAITASTADERVIKTRCLEQGFSAFISKPYILSNLLEIIAEQLHITLQYDESSHEEIARDKVKYTLPVQAILDTLMSFTRSGDIDAVLGLVKNIMQMESGKYKDFAEQIELLAEEFQFEEIESFVTTCQSGKPNE